MAKQRIQMDSPTRVEDLAQDIYASMLGMSAGKTLKSLAERAFEASVAFWAHAAERTEKTAEKTETITP